MLGSCKTPGNPLRFSAEGYSPSLGQLRLAAFVRAQMATKILAGRLLSSEVNSSRHHRWQILQYDHDVLT